MFDLRILIDIEFQILIFFAMGIIMKRKGVMDERVDGFLSSLVLNLIMPVNIFLSFYTTVSVESLRSSGILVGVGLIVAALVIVLGTLLPKSMDENKRKIAQYSILISNGSLIGLPLVQGLCGSIGVFYANIFMIPTRILSFATGEKYFNPDYAGAKLLETFKKFLLNPITLAMIFGFILNMLKISVPSSIQTVFSSLSLCMTPLALILVGSTMVDAAKHLKTSSGAILSVSFFRLIISPMLTFVVCLLLRVSMDMMIVAVLINATPVASMATIFAQKYKGDTSFSSNCVFISTGLSFGSLWIVCSMMASL